MRSTLDSKKFLPTTDEENASAVSKRFLSKQRVDKVDKKEEDDLIKMSPLTAVTEEWASDSLSNFYLMGLESYKVQLRRRGR